MSNIIDPHTGRPVRPQQPQVGMQDVIRVLTVHDAKINELTKQSIHLGLFVEYCLEKIANTGIELNPEGFPAYAQQKIEEMQLAAREEAERRNQQEVVQENSEDDIQVDLEEEEE